MNITILYFHSRPNTNCSEFRLPKTQLYKVFQSNVNFSLDLCVCHHKMLSNQIFSIRQKCWMPPNFSASLLMNITILDFQSRHNTNCSEFRLPMTQLYIVFQSNVNFSLDSCIGYHKMWSNQIFSIRQKCWLHRNFSASLLMNIRILDFHSRPNTHCSEFRLLKTQLYKVFQSNVNFSLDLCVCHHKMLSNQIFSKRQKCWMPPNFSASLLMNITILDFQSGPNTRCSEFILPMTQLYIVLQSNVNFSLDSCIGYHKMWSNQIFSIRQKCWMPPNFSASSPIDITILDFHSRPNTNCSEFKLPMTQLYKVFQSNVSISLDLCIWHLKMWSDEISSIRQKCWMPRTFSASLLMNITILDFQSGPNTNCSEFRLPMTQLYIVFQSNVNFSLDSRIGYNKMWSNQIFSIRQKCWLPPNFSASLLMNIRILDFHSRPNTNCSDFRLPKTELYKVFQSNVNFSLDLCVCHHKMLSNQIFSERQKCWMPPNFSASLLMNITILDFHSRPNTNCSGFRLPKTQLYIVFQSNVNFSLDSGIGYHKMWSNQFFP